MEYEIEIPRNKADQIGKAPLLDLDVQVYILPGSHHHNYCGRIVDERSNLVLCQTEDIFISREHGTAVLNKIIANLQKKSKSKKFTAEITYNLKID